MDNKMRKLCFLFAKNNDEVIYENGSIPKM